MRDITWVAVDPSAKRMCLQKVRPKTQQYPSRCRNIADPPWPCPSPAPRAIRRPSQRSAPSGSRLPAGRLCASRAGAGRQNARKLALPRGSWELSMEDPTTPLDTPEVVGGLKTRLFEGPKSIGSLWVRKIRVRKPGPSMGFLVRLLSVARRDCV